MSALCLWQLHITNRHLKARKMIAPSRNIQPRIQAILKIDSSYCDLRREVAYNMYLIYQKSGTTDLVEQVLKDYSTF
ncbi:hypothetical protein Patl1_07436 [Pistacia atlantica]|uniref:Uncharacterized protein n=1 Tax=Pistacia atlantica TaxID=434234 RepID=A0ACC1AKI6_9ROSI|nr:hypothetical protein Patl1_07436 [Pistacia atlantica]